MYLFFGWVKNHLQDPNAPYAQEVNCTFNWYSGTEQPYIAVISASKFLSWTAPRCVSWNSCRVTRTWENALQERAVYFGSQFQMLHAVFISCHHCGTQREKEQCGCQSVVVDKVAHLMAARKWEGTGRGWRWTASFQGAAPRIWVLQFPHPAQLHQLLIGYADFESTTRLTVWWRQNCTEAITAPELHLWTLLVSSVSFWETLHA